MTRLHRTGLLAVPVMAAGLIALARASGPTGANDPPKTPSMEDELRQMKRRLDKLEGERAELTQRANEAEAALEKERADRKTDLKKANARIDGAVAQAVLDRVPLGAMVPYFGAGDTPPKGYVFADDLSGPLATWPHAAWVPKHLKEDKAGRPTHVKVPNMRGHLVGGAGAPEQAGLLWADGKLEFTLTVDGKDFSLPPQKAGASPGSFWALNAGPGEIGVAMRGGTVRLSKKNSNGGILYEGDVINSVSVAHPASQVFSDTSIRGKTSVPAAIKLDKPDALPPHLRCRWIIRVE